ncbi:MAG: beta-galactosidase trimerization domain-containing protein, partial [Chloroflexi bacterium]|nr:beta-galactosidase trimerization domain-containing protein [Chloroflexota bacterium]
AGHEHTRIFQEVAGLGTELHGLGTQLLGARTQARVALMFSWPNWWAVEYKPGLSASLDYLEEVLHYYSTLWRRNIAVDIISPDSPLEDYDLVIAPLLYMVSEQQGVTIERYVAAGGVFLTTYFSGIVAEDGRAWLGGYPGPLRRTLGIWVEEVDPLPPGQSNSLVIPDSERLSPGSYTCDLWDEVLHLEGARALAQFRHDFYAGWPAVTEHHFGQGWAYYIATRPEPQFLDQMLGVILTDLGITAPLPAPDGVEVTRRLAGEQEFMFILNHHPEEREIALPEPMRDLLTGRVFEHRLSLAGRGVAILVAQAANPAAA